jgi:peptidoglycan/LPS O-acetylase OafA/YrhL
MEKKDSIYINRLRGASILRVVLGHLGLGWIFLPYSSFIGIFLPVLFFCSGYIFFYLFKKSENLSAFIFRRLSGILIPFYLVYVVALLGHFFLFGIDFHRVDFEYILRIVFVAPEIKDMPYPLGQIWYLRVLIFCTILSPVVFILGNRNKYYLLLPVFVAVLLASIQTGFKLHRYFFYLGHNLIQEAIYGGYFFIGAFVWNTDWRNRKSFIAILIVMNIIIAIGVLLHTGGGIQLGLHSYAPNMYYFSLGVAGILIVLVLAEVFEKIFISFDFLGRLLDFCSRHSYGIYLNHSFFIVFYEVLFGLKGVMGDPILAAVKVLLVVISSLVFAVPITYLSQYILRVFRKEPSMKLQQF